MDSININNIFKPHGENKTLDVKSLYNPEKQRIKNSINFSVQHLIDEREEKRKKVLKQYKKIYNICLNRIVMVNKLGRMEFVYDVPEAIFRYPDYNPIECLDYIQEKLKKQRIESQILSALTIWVSWEFI